MKDDEKGFGQGMGRWNGQGSGEVEAGGEETVWGRKRGNRSEGKKRVSPSAERQTCIVPYVDPTRYKWTDVCPRRGWRPYLLSLYTC